MKRAREFNILMDDVAITHLSFGTEVRKHRIIRSPPRQLLLFAQGLVPEIHTKPLKSQSLLLRLLPARFRPDEAHLFTVVNSSRSWRERNHQGRQLGCSNVGCSLEFLKHT